jgi:hypothetical protein
VVINGPDRDRTLVGELRADPRLRVALLDGADLPAALQAGRQMVETTWFAELDDDDILLPDALATRVRALQDRPEFDAVVTNGFDRNAGSGSDALIIDDFEAVETDPLRALLRANWLLPGSWLCRTSSVGRDVFEGMPRFLECTYLALRLVTRYRVRFLNCPTVVYYRDSPLAESKSEDYLLGQATALRRLLDLDLPSDVRAEFRSRVRQACQANVRLHLKEGRVRDAWCWHLQSLRERGGWRSLHYTALFLYDWLTK